MFIRVKTINGSPYAYLVQNSWTDAGSRQKSTKYLGRVIPVGKVETPVHPAQGNAEHYLKSLLSSMLLNAGFTKHESDTELRRLVRGDCVVDLHLMHVINKGKPAVLEINQGFLCDLTLRNLLLFKEKKYSQDLQAAGLHPGKVLAQRILETGVIMTPEQFILTFQFLVPNADVLMQYLFE